MQLPHNAFKAALRAGRSQIGCWVSLADPSAAEIAATAGFDWLVIDNEHAPNDLRSTLSQLRAVAPYPAHPVVRLVSDETWMMKQALDVGAQTLLIPMVETVAQAGRLARAMRYAPEGIRGMGSRGARASRYGAVTDYIERAHEELCLLVQVETRAGLAALDDILGIEGIDGVFIGPSDLSADLGYPGRANAPEVLEVIAQTIRRVRAAGKAPGVLATDPDWARVCLADGAQFVALGLDTMVLAASLRRMAAGFADLPGRR